MNKLDLKKLIANDIINYAMDEASETNYIVLLNSYLDYYDEDSKKYILDNIDEIIYDIDHNENVLDLVVEKENDDITINMIFYWDKLLNQIEKIVLEKANNSNVSLDLKDVRKIAKKILDSDTFNENLNNEIIPHEEDYSQEL